jgi:hypothetical protein
MIKDFGLIRIGKWIDAGKNINYELSSTDILTD